MEIREGNRLIAEFMGVKIGIDQYSWRPGVHEPLQERHLNYHESWGWIMPVVEKIEELGWGCKIYLNAMTIPVLQSRKVAYLLSADSKIQGIYDTVIQFISWYNSSKGLAEGSTGSDPIIFPYGFQPNDKK